jgi:hypothetical protein
VENTSNAAARNGIRRLRENAVDKPGLGDDVQRVYGTLELGVSVGEKSVGKVLKLGGKALEKGAEAKDWLWDNTIGLFD